MTKTKWSRRMLPLALIPLLGRMGYAIHKLQRAQEHNRQVETAQKLQESLPDANVTNPTKEMNQLGETLNNILEDTDTQAPQYDSYTPVDTSHSLGQRGDQYFLYSPTSNSEMLLDGVSLAYVLVVEEPDTHDAFQVIVAQKAQQWLVLNNQGETVLTLPFDDITAQTRLVVKDQTLIKAD